MRSLPRHLLALLVVLAPRLQAQVVRYEVAVTTSGSPLFHVTADFPTAGKDTLYLSLPAWSPGAYEIQNYARYVRGFRATSATGQSLFWDRADKDTWRVVTGRGDRVTVGFDYLADTIDLSLARIVGDFGQFLGTNLFLFEEGRLDRPAEVRFRLPAGWRVTTALPGPDAAGYRAADYHELADAMTFVGRYNLDSLQVDGKWIRIALWPAADYTPAVSRNLRNGIEKMAQVQNRLMGGAPYDVYTVFFNVIHEPIGFGGGLEHSSAQYDVMPAQAFADPAGTLGDFMYPLLSHEFFHLWNVKRIRPADMWPYDYRAEQYTPLLWWSEGVTDYYADLTNLRAGLWSPDQFLQSITGNIQQVEAIPEPWSAEDGSEATWINEIYINSSQLYYPKGSLLGMLLDISIRDASDNAHSLDEVMRTLFTRYYRQGKGFTTGDLIGELRRAGMPDPDGFYQRYINGRDSLPYDAVFAKAGIVVTRDVVSQPFVGVSTGVTPAGAVDVQGITPGSAAEAAGLRPGDVLVSVGDIPVTLDQDWASAFRARYRGRAGQPLALTVRRGGQTLTLNTVVRERGATRFALARAPSPTPKQARIWQGLATGTTPN
ncbi:MAG TPA: PDZ domain-containing protein [Gemmatimonadales bacterium]|jgi:predicted metalloprotease with PDZ domain|nr:PDZ domain-containing protein [Gemmatimonadales bacterium]